MMIIDNGYDSGTREFAYFIITIVCNNTVLRNIYSAQQMVERYLLVILAQEKKYGALITGQLWSSEP